MIPWIESHTIAFGPLTIHTWGLLVAIAFIVAASIAARRATAKGLDPKIMWDAAFWVFIAAVVGSRLFHVVFYDPHFYLQHPLAAIDPTAPGFAILGGIAGGALAAWIYLRRKKVAFMAYADAMAWALPWGFGIGRIGCFLIHDHPGTLTHSLLGVRYPDGAIRHDLGLELSLFGFALGGALLIINAVAKRKKIACMNAPGFWVGIFLVFDGVGRFFLDFLRIADVRWGPLTPTQWALLGSVALGLWLLREQRKCLHI